MKAVVFDEHGGPEVLKYRDVPDPTPAADQVLIKVKACALNHLDLWCRRGMPGIKIPMPHISGSDVAGEVVSAGELVKAVRPGDRVMVSPGLSCGRCRACLCGEDNLCPQYDILGFRSAGGYAEYVVVPEENVIPISDKIDFNQAAAFPLVFLTAWHMLVTRAAVKPGEEVLILAAGSGVGMAGIQVARLFGARVIATAGSDEKLARARELGAEATINHNTQDVAEEARRLSGGRGVDLVFEHIGAATWEKSILSLAHNGRLVTCGATSGFAAKTDIRYLFSRHLTILGSYMGSKGELLEAYRFLEQGKLKPVVDRALPLEEAARAQQIMEDRKQFGKLVLNP